MASKAWTEAEEAILKRHSKTGKPASDADAFWAQLEGSPGLEGRSARAIIERASKLYLYSNTLYGAVPRTCPRCGIIHVKKVGSRNPEVADYCIPCVDAMAIKRHKNNHKRVCVRCSEVFKAGRRRRVCDACKAIWGDKRLLAPKPTEVSA